MYDRDALFKTLLKYNYNLNRGQLTVPDYLEKHFDEYYSDIVNAVNGDNPFLGQQFIDLLNHELPILQTVIEKTVTVSRQQRAALIKDSYVSAYELFNFLKPYFLSRFSWAGSDGQYYRIRQGDFRIKNKSEALKKKKELFHVKDSQRHLNGAYRYSIPGYPSLYLSSGIELAWFECNMPRKFSYCAFRFSEIGDNSLRLIDFSNRPIDLLSSVHVWLLNNSINDDEKQKIYRYFANYILTYPLSAACSLRVADRSVKFVEEYSVPQMLMQWVKQDESFDGVRYKSAFYSNLVDGMGAVNIALPVKQFREDGLCQNLTSKLTVSDIGYMDIDNEFSKKNELLEQLKEHQANLILSFNKIGGQYAWPLLQLCEVVQKTYGALISGRYQNMELLLNNINCISDYIHTIRVSKELLVDDALERDKSRFGHNEMIDRAEAVHQIESLCDILNKIVVPNCAFDFSFANLENFESI